MTLFLQIGEAENEALDSIVDQVDDVAVEGWFNLSTSEWPYSELSTNGIVLRYHFLELYYWILLSLTHTIQRLFRILVTWFPI